MEEVQQAITQAEESYFKEAEVGDFMGDGEVKDPNEIVIDDMDIGMVRSSIRGCYAELMSLIPDDWKDPEYKNIKQHNMKFLGVDDAKNCDDIDKLKWLLSDLEGRIYKFEQEVNNG
jgi:hypothetical protein